MAELGVDHFAGLRALLDEAGLPVRFVKTGPWVDNPHDVVAEFPDRVILYHHGSPIAPGGGTSEAAAASLERWQQQARYPWLSMHLDCYARDDVDAFVERGQPLRAYDGDEVCALVSMAVREISRRVTGPLLLENVDAWPSLPTMAATAPRVIRRVLDETGCGLLLDIAHARVSASEHGCDVHAYLEELPLERTVEVHVSGPRMVNGRLVDSHEPMLDEDYELLRWVLRRTRPRAVTLEYNRDVTQVRMQLERLERLLAEA